MKWPSITGGVLLIFVGGGAWLGYGSAASPRGGDPITSPRIAMETALADAACGGCENCCDDPNSCDGHRITSSGGGYQSHSCIPSFCGGFHHPCGEARLDLIDESWEALEAGDIPELSRILAANPEVMELNHRRRAIQIRGCEGGFAASFALNSKVLTLLSD